MKYRHLLFLILLWIILPTPSQAQTQLLWRRLLSDNGFITSPLLLDMYYAPQFPGSSYIGQEIFMMSLVAADTNQTRIFALRQDGISAFSSFPYLSRTGMTVLSSPAGARFSDTQPPNVFFGSNLGLYYLRLNDFTPDPILQGPNITACPVLVNLDTDETLELVALTDNGLLYAWNWNGTNATTLPGFPVSLNDAATMMTPATTDLSNDSHNEIVVTTTSGKVFAYTDQGVLVSGSWPRQLPGTLSTSAALGKVDTFSDVAKNIVVADDGGLVHVFRPNGSGIPAWPKQMGGATETSPILVDLDLDGHLEVIVCAADSMVYAWRGNGNLLSGWPVDLSAYLTSDRADNNQRRANRLFADPIAVDVDNDYAIEVIVPIIDDGILIAINPNGSIQTTNGWPIVIGAINNDNAQASPAIGDINNDGYLELTIGTFASVLDSCGIFCYRLGQDPGVDQLKPWPMFRQNVRRSGAALSVGAGSPPSCHFPTAFYMAVGEALTIDAAEHVSDIDTPSPVWNCQLTGISHLQVTQTSNTVFTLSNPTAWVGAELATARVADPDGHFCSNSFYLVSGQKGDVNRDNAITWGDATTLAYRVLMHDADFYESWAGDMDNDARLTIYDVLAIIDMQ